MIHKYVALSKQDCQQNYSDDDIKKREERYYRQWEVKPDSKHAPFYILPEQYSRTISYRKGQKMRQVTYDETMNEHDLNKKILRKIPYTNDLNVRLLWKSNCGYHDAKSRPLIMWDDDNNELVDARCFASFINNDICECCGNEYGPPHIFCIYCSSGSHRRCQNGVSGDQTVGVYVCESCRNKKNKNNNTDNISMYNY